MENRNDIIFHSYNRKIGIDYLKIKLHVVDEMINSCKNASLIWSVFLIMTDFFSTGRNPFCVFHILKFLVLYIDYLLYKSHLDRLSFFQWTNMLMGTMWFFGILVIVPLTIKFGLEKTSVLFVLESCFTTIVILLYYRTVLNKKVIIT